MNEEGKGVAISTKADLEIQSLFGIAVVAHPRGFNWNKFVYFPYFVCLFDLGFSHAMNEEGKGVAISTKADMEIQSFFGIAVVAHPGRFVIVF